MRVRIVATFPGKHTVQVVSKRSGRVIIHKHLGTFATESEKQVLLERAHAFIKQQTSQESLFDAPFGFTLTDIVVTDSKPLFVYQLLGGIYDKLGFSGYDDALIRDLVIARIYRPASKKETREILKDVFNCDYSLKTIYRHLKKGVAKGVKDIFQKALIDFTRSSLGDELRLVFYDVTTLYFDSSVKEGLRDFGFSKDHRPLDTQIVIGLVVTRDGFPLYFDIFQGNTFEGHTFLPVIQKIQALLGTTKLVVIADAAMISKDNIDKLVAAEIDFVVGARVANLPVTLSDTIATNLQAQDGKTTTVSYRNHRLVCHYSAKRAAKDRSERTKQIAKAREKIADPSKMNHRHKFVKTENQTVSLHNELIAKAEKLEGVKGYLTNTTLPEAIIIDRYHDLWRIENAFRLTKSDLEARPIFHQLDETITSHLVTVFAGLAISRYLEIKTGMSIKNILAVAGKVLTHKITNIRTGETAYIETQSTNSVLKEKLELLKSLGH